MSNILVLEHCNVRVVTTKQLADFYGTDPAILSNNFKRNEHRFKKGVHFYRLEGEELRAFRTNHQFDDSSNRLNLLYLWTERGAARHAKMLNSEKAWEVFERLEETYFSLPEAQPSLPSASTRHLTNDEQALVSAIAEKFTETVIRPLYREILSMRDDHNALKAEVQSLRRTLAHYITNDGSAPAPSAPTPGKRRLEMQYEPPRAGSVVITTINMMTLEAFCERHKIYLSRRDRNSLSRKISTRCLKESAPMYRRYEGFDVKNNEYPEYIIREMMKEVHPDIALQQEATA